MLIPRGRTPEGARQHGRGRPRATGEPVWLRPCQPPPPQAAPSGHSGRAGSPSPRAPATTLVARSVQRLYEHGGEGRYADALPGLAAIPGCVFENVYVVSCLGLSATPSGWKKHGTGPRNLAGTSRPTLPTNHSLILRSLAYTRKPRVGDATASRNHCKALAAGAAAV